MQCLWVLHWDCIKCKSQPPWVSTNPKTHRFFSQILPRETQGKDDRGIIYLPGATQTWSYGAGFNIHFHLVVVKGTGNIENNHMLVFVRCNSKKDQHSRAKIGHGAWGSGSLGPTIPCSKTGFCSSFSLIIFFCFSKFFFYIFMVMRCNVCIYYATRVTVLSSCFEFVLICRDGLLCCGQTDNRTTGQPDRGDGMILWLHDGMHAVDCSSKRNAADVSRHLGTNEVWTCVWKNLSWWNEQKMDRGGIEPPTFRMQSGRSPTELTTHLVVAALMLIGTVCIHNTTQNTKEG